MLHRERRSGTFAPLTPEVSPLFRYGPVALALLGLIGAGMLAVYQDAGIVRREFATWVVLAVMVFALPLALALRHRSLLAAAAKGGTHRLDRTHLFTRMVRRNSEQDAPGSPQDEPVATRRAERRASGWIVVDARTLTIHFRDEGQESWMFAKGSLTAVESVSTSPSFFFAPVLGLTFADGDVIDAVLVKPGVADLFGVTGRDIRRLAEQCDDERSL